MLETPHVIVGAVIATKVVNPALAIPLAFGSHFLLDKLPHWNPHLYTETKKFGKPTKQSTILVIIDASTALIIGTLIASRTLPDMGYFLTVLASCLAAVLPDVIEAPYFFLKKRSESMKKWIDVHRSIQSNTKSIFWGLQTQIITVLASFWWLLA